MRKVVLAMMTSLNGRLDNIGDWLAAPSDEIDAEFDHVYSTFDTVLVGHNAYQEMASYWPVSETDEHLSETNKRLGRKLNAYKKYVFSKKAAKEPLAWNNSEWVSAPTDEDLIHFIKELKAEQGADMHVIGGARFAQSMSGLGLVDEYHLYVFPVVSAGITWFDHIKAKSDLDFLSAMPFKNGAVCLRYRSKNIG